MEVKTGRKKGGGAAYICISWISIVDGFNKRHRILGGAGSQQHNAENEAIAGLHFLKSYFQICKFYAPSSPTAAAAYCNTTLESNRMNTYAHAI